MKTLGKAGTLIFLEKKQTKYNFIIPKLIKYSKEYFYKNKNKVAKKVKYIFKERKIIIRSSLKMRII